MRVRVSPACPVFCDSCFSQKVFFSLFLSNHPLTVLRKQGDESMTSRLVATPKRAPSTTACYETPPLLRYDRRCCEIGDNATKKVTNVRHLSMQEDEAVSALITFHDVRMDSNEFGSAQPCDDKDKEDNEVTNITTSTEREYTLSLCTSLQEALKYLRTQPTAKGMKKQLQDGKYVVCHSDRPYMDFTKDFDSFAVVKGLCNGGTCLVRVPPKEKRVITPRSSVYAWKYTHRVGQVVCLWHRACKHIENFDKTCKSCSNPTSHGKCEMGIQQVVVLRK